jgi:hypothetical protein
LLYHCLCTIRASRSACTVILGIVLDRGLHPSPLAEFQGLIVGKQPVVLLLPLVCLPLPVVTEAPDKIVFALLWITKPHAQPRFLAPSFHAPMLVLAVAVVAPCCVVTSVYLAWAIAVRIAEGVWPAGSSLGAVGTLAGVLVAK